MRPRGCGFLLLALAGILLVCGAGDAAGQAMTGPAADPIDRSREISGQTFPPAPAQQAGEVWVPERRVPVPGSEREMVIPGHWERRASDQQSVGPPLSGYETRGGKIIHIPGGERPPAEIRRHP